MKFLRKNIDSDGCLPLHKSCDRAEFQNRAKFDPQIRGENHEKSHDENQNFENFIFCAILPRNVLQPYQNTQKCVFMRFEFVLHRL